jgi:signal transduction histidine kinase
MSMMLRLQIFAIATSIVSLGFSHLALTKAMPFAAVMVADGLQLLFLLWWTVSIVVIRRRPGFHDDTPDAWFNHTLAVFWAGNIATIVAIWLFMDDAGESQRLLIVMFCLSPVAIETMGTVRSPRYGLRPLLATIAPPALPVAILIFYAIHDDAFTLPVMLFLPMYTAIMLLLREFLQDSVNRGWQAMAIVEADRDSKTRFLASASHDLGQPLQAARLYLDQMVRGSDATRRDRAATQVDAALGSVERQLRQMIDHLRLDAGTVSARPSPVALGSVIARVAAIAEPSAMAAGITIHALPSRMTITVDADLLERALSNLADNAIRHARARRLLIGTRRHGAGTRIWVIDDGRGVAPADVPRLFEDYFQGSDHDDEVRGGFGLGLASVRRIADLMGGAVGIDQRWRRGAAFFLELPGVGRLA